MPSRTRAAINKGYGIDPTIFDGMILPPRAIGRMRKSRGGGKTMFKKGSPEAKKHMAYLRSLRGKGSYTDAALEGYGSYTNAALEGYGKYSNAALRGCGFSEILTPLTEQFGEGIGNLVQALAKKLHTSLTDLATNPDKLLSAINQYAPSIFSKVKNFFNRIFRRKKMPSKEEIARLKEYLKEQQRIKQLKQIQRKPPQITYPGYGDDDDDIEIEEPEYYVKPKPKPKPKPKKPPKKPKYYAPMDDEDDYPYTSRSYMDDVD